jgi:hypothetical protein
MSVVFQSDTNVMQGGNLTTFGVDQTITAGTNLCAIALLMTAGNCDFITSITLDSIAMKNEFEYNGSGGERLAIFSLIKPNLGLQTCTATFDNTNSASLSLFVFENMHQGTPILDTDTYEGTDGPGTPIATTTVASDPDGFVIAGVSTTVTGFTQESPGQTQMSWGEPGLLFFTSYKAGTGNDVSMSSDSTHALPFVSLTFSVKFGLPAPTQIILAI